MDLARVDKENFFLCDMSDMKDIAATIDHIPLPLSARYAFCLAPVNLRDALCKTAIKRYAKLYEREGKVPVGLRE